MNNYLSLNELNCKNCYKCIRHCPVKSIKFSENHAYIIEKECILCGTCYVVCPQNAKKIRNDIKKVKILIESGRKVVASIAPSFIAEYENVNIKIIENALKKLGFNSAEETAKGATIVKKEYEKIVENSEKNIVISSCCHTINKLIQSKYEKSIDYLADVITPMHAHCLDIKERFSDAATVFIGPCISKKEEADELINIVDAVITFQELNEWLEEENIEFEQHEEELTGGLTRIFPTSGGIINSMNYKNSNYNYFVVDGIEDCIRALEDIETGAIKSRCFIEMSACKGSCINGPVMNKNNKPITRLSKVMSYYNRNDFVVKEYVEKLLKKQFYFNNLKNNSPSEREIKEILKKMGKIKAEQELNCGTCGYNTCREKAIAVFQGKADFSMCLPFLKEKAESFSDHIIYNSPNGIMVLNEELEIQQINKSACEIINIDYDLNLIGSQVVQILNPSDYVVVMETGENIYNKKVYLAEYEKYIEETIIYDKEYHIVMSIMRNITYDINYKTQKEELCKNTIEIADAVIEKQMRIAQEIASLLGETVAETKVALSNLKGKLIDE